MQSSCDIHMVDHSPGPWPLTQSGNKQPQSSNTTKDAQTNPGCISPPLWSWGGDIRRKWVGINRSSQIRGEPRESDGVGFTFSLLRLLGGIGTTRSAGLKPSLARLMALRLYLLLLPAADNRFRPVNPSFSHHFFLHDKWAHSRLCVAMGEICSLKLNDSSLLKPSFCDNSLCPHCKLLPPL